MGDLIRAFDEDEAALWGEEIHAAAGDFAGECFEIEFGILAAEGELEAAFAGGIAMTGAEVAAGFGNGGHHVVAEGHRVGGRRRRQSDGAERTNEAGDVVIHRAAG